MKTSLQNRIKKYGTMAAAVTAVAAVSDADAQVMYTDINPDETYSTHGDSYDLDLNGDAIIDFQILQATSGYNSAYNAVLAFPNSAYSTNNIMGSLFYSVIPMPYALNAGTPIGASGNFPSGAYSTNFLAYVYQGTGVYANWNGQSDKYLGLRFDISGSTHYGWARLSVASGSGSFTIKDYAYEATAGVSIDAGDMGVSIEEFANSNLIKTTAVDNRLTVKIPAELVGSQITVLTVTGEEVMNNILNKTNSQFDMSDYSKGVYVITIENQNDVYSNKVVLN